MEPSKSGSSNTESSNTGLVVGIIIAVLLLLIISIVLYLRTRRSKNCQDPQEFYKMSTSDMNTSLISVLDRIRRITSRKASEMTLAESISFARSQARHVTPIKIVHHTDSFVRRFTQMISFGNKVSPKYDKLQDGLYETGRSLYCTYKGVLVTSGLPRVDGQVFTTKTGINLEGDDELILEADMMYICHVLNSSLLSETNRRFQVDMLPEYLIEAKRMGYIPDHINEMTEDAAWKKIMELYCSDSYSQCTLLSKAVEDMAFRVIESIERSLADVFLPNFPFEFDVPHFRKVALHFICFYTACKALNPLFELYMPANGTLFDGNRMVANDLARGEDMANVLFADKFGMITGETVVIKASVMCM